MVDEVSMLSLKLFTLLNEIGKAVRGNGKPFGGIQLIFAGDFYQLPPVLTKKNKLDILKKLIKVDNMNEIELQMAARSPIISSESMPYLFDSFAWTKLIEHGMKIVELDKVFRQKDSSFIEMLNEFREGKCSDKSNQLIEQCKKTEFTDDIVVFLNFKFSSLLIYLRIDILLIWKT